MTGNRRVLRTETAFRRAHAASGRTARRDSTEVETIP